MAITPGLQLRQTQNLVMTPQLRLAIRILQMTSADVSTLISEELEKNPLLISGDATGDAPDEKPAPDQHPVSGELLPGDGMLPAPDAAPLDSDYVSEAIAGGFDDGYSIESAPPLRIGGTRAFAETDDREAFRPAPPMPLHDRLKEQVRLTPGFTPRQRKIAVTLISRLDHIGRLAIPVAETAAALMLPEPEVEDVRQFMMTEFEPAGLFALSLTECLAAQLRAQNRFDPAIATLLDHPELLAGRHYTKLRALCAVDAEDFAGMLADLRRLDPHPSFDPALPATTLVPDLMLRRDSRDLWMPCLNEDAFPSLRIDQRLRDRIIRHGGREDVSFVTARVSEAGSLIRALDQRGRTMVRVAAEIFHRQPDFLRLGADGLRPLTLKDVAEATGFHESTVSRVTAGKYIDTPRGIFELKYFFTTAVGSAGAGEKHSSEAIRSRIRRMVSAETARTVLSDDEIMTRLRAEGIDIARRTVAKYRDALHIPSSVQRKREKAATA